MSPHRFDRFKRWERHVALPDGAKIFVRPIRPEDETLYPAFLTAVTQDDLRLRFFAPVKELSHSAIARFTQIDYARAMAFIAIEEATGQMLGVVRIHANSEHRSGEYAILVRSDLKGHGLGWLLMELMVEYARAEGLESVQGQVLLAGHQEIQRERHRDNPRKRRELRRSGGCHRLPVARSFDLRPHRDHRHHQLAGWPA